MILIKSTGKFSSFLFWGMKKKLVRLGMLGLDVIKVYFGVDQEGRR